MCVKFAHWSLFTRILMHGCFGGRILIARFLYFCFYYAWLLVRGSNYKLKWIQSHTFSLIWWFFQWKSPITDVHHRVLRYIYIIQFSTDASWEALERGPACSFSLFSGPRSITRKSALLPPRSRHRDSRAFFRPAFFNVRFHTAGVIIDLLTATRTAGGCNSTSKSSPIFTVANRCACQLSHAQ